VIGSGAAGLTLASELDGDSQTVCVIESGGEGPDEATQALCDMEIVGHPVREKFMSRARYFGGTCNLWAGRCMRLTRFDLAARDWIPHSGWPLAFEELERYYPRAGTVLRLPAPDAVDSRVSSSRMSSVERSLFDHSDLEPTVALWGKKPLRFGATYRAQLRRSRNVSVYLNATVTEIRLNEAGNRVEDCTAMSLGGRALRLRRAARAFDGRRRRLARLAARGARAGGAVAGRAGRAGHGGDIWRRGRWGQLTSPTLRLRQLIGRRQAWTEGGPTGCLKGALSLRCPAIAIHLILALPVANRADDVIFLGLARFVASVELGNRL